jgi:3-methyladenine DNA glycosylase AlkD
VTSPFKAQGSDRDSKISEMTLKEVLTELKSYGNEQTRKVLKRHGAKEPFFGVKIEYLRKIQKKIRKDHELALELFETGNTDAMQLAGYICEPDKFSMADLQNWAEKSYWYLLSEYTVASVAAESGLGFEAATGWIKSDRENIASSGWATLAVLIAKKKDTSLDPDILQELLESIPGRIHQSPDRVRYTMNNFVIAAGAFVPELHQLSIETAKKTGKVSVDMGGTACKVPDAITYIGKIHSRTDKLKKQANN